MKKRSFVYLGLWDMGLDHLFVKIGKSDHPERRARAYNTHCPCGLTSMYAAEVSSPRNAYATEYRLMLAMRDVPNVSTAGGEWFKVSHSDLDSVFDQFIKIAGEPFKVFVDRGHRIANFGA